MKEEEKRTLNRFLGYKGIQFGDYLLFQEYQQGSHDGNQYSYTVTKPILVIYLGSFIADQTLGFNYVKWINESHVVKINNEYVKDIRVCNEVEDIKQHIEWDDYLDIIGHWKEKPKWKEILAAYRKRNIQQNILSDSINWD